MSLGMGMRMTHTIRHTLICIYCGNSVSEHADNCPQGRVEFAQAQFLGLFCPKCKKFSVELNSSDFYECRDCHTQFTTGDWADDWERTRLMDGGKYFPVLVLPNKGHGEFPVDAIYQAARADFELARRNRKRLKRLNSKPKGELPCTLKLSRIC